MMDYIATFWTHLSAMRTLRALNAAGIAATARPVPRELSTSCGTCVCYHADDPCVACLHQDFETVYLRTGERSYEVALQNDEIV